MNLENEKTHLREEDKRDEEKSQSTKWQAKTNNLDGPAKSVDKDNDGLMDVWTRAKWS